MFSELVISPYAPYRDGIASYTVQEVRVRRKRGENIEVLSPQPSAAHHHLELGGFSGALSLLRRASQHSRFTVHVYPEIMYGRCRNRIERQAVWSMWIRIAKAVPVELRIHEVVYSLFENSAREKRLFAKFLEACDSVYVHSDVEAAQLVEAVGVDRKNVELFDHGQYFEKSSTVSVAQARQSLGLDPNKFIFLSIGFIQYQKGFDRGVDAMAKISATAAQLHIVGSARVEADVITDFLDELESKVSGSENCHLHVGYVSDADFDTWIQAADCVVLPYREIWSSSVLERAKLFERPTIVSSVGGLADQGSAETRVISSELELEAEMRKVYDSWANENKMESSSGVMMEPNEVNSGADLVSKLKQTAGASAPKPSTVRSNSRSKLENFPKLQRPSSISTSRLRSRMKSSVLKLIDWQVAPVASHVDGFQKATTSTVRDLEQRIAALEAMIEDSNQGSGQ